MEAEVSASGTSGLTRCFHEEDKEESLFFPVCLYRTFWKAATTAKQPGARNLIYTEKLLHFLTISWFLSGLLRLWSFRFTFRRLSAKKKKRNLLEALLIHSCSKGWWLHHFLFLFGRLDQTSQPSDLLHEPEPSAWIVQSVGTSRRFSRVQLVYTTQTYVGAKPRRDLSTSRAATKSVLRKRSPDFWS